MSVSDDEYNEVESRYMVQEGLGLIVALIGVACHSRGGKGRDMNAPRESR